jgi:hypothetical protein
VVQTLESDGPVRAIERVRDHIVSAGKSVAVWTGKSAQIASPHSGEITCIRYCSERDVLVTGSRDASLAVFAT